MGKTSRHLTYFLGKYKLKTSSSLIGYKEYTVLTAEHDLGLDTVTLIYCSNCYFSNFKAILLAGNCCAHYCTLNVEVRVAVKVIFIFYIVGPAMCICHKPCLSFWCNDCCSLLHQLNLAKCRTATI